MTTRKRDSDPTIDRNGRPEVRGGRGDLRVALDADEIEARYRPVVRTADGSAVGLEMEPGRHGRGGGPFAGDRLAVTAARAGMATQLDERSLSLVGRDARRGALPPQAEWVAVSLSSKSLRVPQMMGRALRLSGELGRQGRDLVVTLSAKDPDVDFAEAALGLSRLRSSGVRVALGHLGEGSFPFSRLADYPLDFVKMKGRGPTGESTVSDLVGYLRALVRVVRAAGPRVVLALEEEGENSPHPHVLEEADFAVGGKFGPAVPLPDPA